MNATKKMNRKNLHLLSYLALIMISGANVGIKAMDREMDPIREEDAFKEVKKIKFILLKKWDHSLKETSPNARGQKKLKNIMEYYIVFNRADFPHIPKKDLPNSKLNKFKLTKAEKEEFKGLEFVSLYGLLKFAFGYAKIDEGDREHNYYKDYNAAVEGKITSRDENEAASRFYTTLHNTMLLHFPNNAEFLKQYNKEGILYKAVEEIMAETAYLKKIREAARAAKDRSGQGTESTGEEDFEYRIGKASLANIDLNTRDNREAPSDTDFELTEQRTNREMERGQGESWGIVPVAVIGGAAALAGIAAMSGGSSSKPKKRRKGGQQKQTQTQRAKA